MFNSRNQCLFNNLGPFLFLWVCLLLGCSEHKEIKSEHNLEKNVKFTPSLKAIATTGIVADMVQNIAGDHIVVESLMGPGVDPHLYKAAPGDIQKLLKADLIFYNGLHLEAKMADVLKKFSRKKPTLALGPAIPEIHARLMGQEDHTLDPHLWMDILLWSKTIDPLVQFLSEQMPKAKEDFIKRGNSYKKKLEDLHKECLQKISSIPEKQRILITAHDAFRYFGRAYGIQVLGIQGISTESEAGLKEINELVHVITQNGVKAVFVESSVSPKNVEALVEGAKSRGAKIKIGGELFSDALGETNTDEGTYIGMLRHNFNAISKELK